MQKSLVGHFNHRQVPISTAKPNYTPTTRKINLTTVLVGTEKRKYTNQIHDYFLLK